MFIESHFAYTRLDFAITDTITLLVEKLNLFIQT